MNCKTCICFEKKNKLSATEITKGKCLRFPPVAEVVGDDDETWTNLNQPDVSPDDMCFEYQPREKWIARLLEKDRK